ncbi:hypothetical protein BsWGS_09110 [Bradybaena similaris]
MSLKALVVGVLVVIFVIPDESDAQTSRYWQTTTGPTTTATTVRELPTFKVGTPATIRPNSEATTVTSVNSGQTPNNCTNNNNNNNSNNSPIKKIERGTDINLNFKIPRQAEKQDSNNVPLLEMLLSINNIN